MEPVAAAGEPTRFGLTPSEREYLWQLISTTISIEGREFLVFGSRATQTARRYSDVDLLVKGRPLAPLEWADLTEAFEESDFLYIVDLVEDRHLSEEFREHALKTVLVLNSSQPAQTAGVGVKS